MAKKTERERNWQPSGNRNAQFELMIFLSSLKFGQIIINNPTVLSLLKCSRPSKLSVFIINPDYFEQPRRRIMRRASRDVFHNFKCHEYTNLRNISQAKSYVDMTFLDFRKPGPESKDENGGPLTKGKLKAELISCYPMRQIRVDSKKILFFLRVNEALSKVGLKYTVEFARAAGKKKIERTRQFLGQVPRHIHNEVKASTFRPKTNILYFPRESQN